MTDERSYVSGIGPVSTVARCCAGNEPRLRGDPLRDGGRPVRGGGELWGRGRHRRGRLGAGDVSKSSLAASDHRWVSAPRLRARNRSNVSVGKRSKAGRRRTALLETVLRPVG